MGGGHSGWPFRKDDIGKDIIFKFRQGEAGGREGGRERERTRWERDLGPALLLEEGWT
jgi:hypothetical protein